MEQPIALDGTRVGTNEASRTKEIEPEKGTESAI